MALNDSGPGTQQLSVWHRHVSHLTGTLHTGRPGASQR